MTARRLRFRLFGGDVRGTGPSATFVGMGMGGADGQKRGRHLPASELPPPTIADVRKSPKLLREPQSKTESLSPLLSFLLAIVPLV